MLKSSNYGNSEILQIADAVAREKNIDSNVIIDAMESSVSIAARKKYGQDRSIRSEIDRKTGEIKIFSEYEVVENDFVPETETGELEDGFIFLKDALFKDSEAKVGDLIKEMLPPIDLGRVAAQTAKQVIVQKVRDAERERQYEDFKGRIGEIINGTVKRVEFGNVIVDLGSAEAIIPRNGVIRGEVFQANDRIRAYVENVSREVKGAQIFLSRTSPMFMAKLFAQEVPEIYDGIIEVKSVAREPGSRAKIAVASHDSSIDPVGSCVGVRGARVQSVIAELQGEKIDIVQWSADPATFLVSAISPAEVARVVIDEEKHRIETVVPDDQLSLAIGRRGQNVRLASELVGWRIDILTEEDESTRRNEEFNKASGLFIEALNIEEIIAQLLITEGFATIDEVAYVDPAELASIEGFDDDVAQELQGRAREYIELKEAQVVDTLKELKIEDKLQELEGLTSAILLQLVESDIKTLDDFADLARDEFQEIVPESGFSDDEIDALIMKARAHWFDDEGEAAS